MLVPVLGGKTNSNLRLSFTIPNIPGRSLQKPCSTKSATRPVMVILLWWKRIHSQSPHCPLLLTYKHVQTKNLSCSLRFSHAFGYLRKNYTEWYCLNSHHYATREVFLYLLWCCCNPIKVYLLHRMRKMDTLHVCPTEQAAGKLFVFVSIIFANVV